MKPITKQSDKKTAFTIIELLTVMSIIVILIGLLVPSLNMVKRYAKEVKQRAQFHSIDSALELFRNEFDDYPDSKYLDDAGKQYPGAVRLCEAMMGQDLLGFHPSSRFRSDGTVPPDTRNLYKETASWSATEWEDNFRSRKGPYLQLERANAYRLKDIYGIGKTGDLEEELFVLCDEYTRVKNKSTGKGIGMPVLYYKANTSGTKHDPNSIPTPTDDKDWIYNYNDNDYLVGLGLPENLPAAWGGDPKHPMFDRKKKFYEETWNEKVEISTGRPYRMDSYILMSAGFDGLYGTRDDIFNFEER